MKRKWSSGLIRLASTFSFCFALLCWSLIGTTGIQAQSQNERLNSLFAALHDAPNEEIAKQIANRIQAIWSKPKSPTADLFMQRAAMAMDADGAPVAIELLDRVIAIEPDFAEGWNRRATAFYMIDDYTRALSDVMETLNREPRHFGALTGLGLILIERGDFTRARAAFEKALALYPMMQSAKDAIEKIDRQTGGAQL